MDGGHDGQERFGSEPVDSIDEADKAIAAQKKEPLAEFKANGLAMTDSAWHSLSAPEIARDFSVDPEAGFSADAAAERQRRFGLNRITARKGVPPWVQFLQQFNQPLVYILLAAVAVTAVLGEWVDSAVILGVVLINAIVGFLQEAKAEKAIASLSSLVTTEATVRRQAQAAPPFGSAGTRRRRATERWGPRPGGHAYPPCERSSDRGGVTHRRVGAGVQDRRYPSSRYAARGPQEHGV